MSLEPSNMTSMQFLTITVDLIIKFRVDPYSRHRFLTFFSKIFKNKKIDIGSQNCYHKDIFSSNTGAISAYMIKALNCKYTIIGHSDNRSEGDTEAQLQSKVIFALKNNLKIIFCIGENKNQKNKKQTFSVLKKQITKVLGKKINQNNRNQ